jgi:hypothetical protein
MFRSAPTDPPGARGPPTAWRMVNVWDAGMAENVLWALGREGPSGRVLVVTHNVHAQIAATAGGPWDAYERMPTSMGRNLRATLSDRYVVIGMREAAKADDAAGNAVPQPFLLDLRRPGEACQGAAFDALLVIDPPTPARPSRLPR